MGWGKASRGVEKNPILRTEGFYSTNTLLPLGLSHLAECESLLYNILDVWFGASYLTFLSSKSPSCKMGIIKDGEPAVVPLLSSLIVFIDREIEIKKKKKTLAGECLFGLVVRIWHFHCHQFSSLSHVQL